MSSPISAVITRAETGLMPGIWLSRAIASAYGATSAPFRASRAAMSASMASIRPSVFESRKAWWSVK